MSEQTTGKRMTVGAGIRQQQVYDFLLAERVGASIDVSKSLFQRMTEELGIRKAHIYVVLHNLHQKGMVTREALPRGEGIRITFPENPLVQVSSPEEKKEKQEKVGSSKIRTIAELRKKILNEIEALDQQRKEYEKLIQGIEIQLEAKKNFIAHLEREMV